MIVKNESAIIKRCLDSALPIIDYLAVVDTGSTDDTIDLIRGWGEEHNIPTSIGERPFDNFGVSRTCSFKYARSHYPQADYALLLDADFLLKIEPDFKKDALTEGAYRLKQINGSLHYYNIRLIRMKLNWECVLTTHEYWTCHDPCVTVEDDHLWIQDVGDGGSKEGRLERDLRLIDEGLNDPKVPPSLHSRYRFYRAQTLSGLGRREEAIEEYRKHIKTASWDEEIFCSKYYIGKCYEAQGDLDAAVNAYLIAYDYRPTRIEPLTMAARIYRYQGHNHVAYLLAATARKVPMTSDVLFVEMDAWTYLLDYELSICAYYVPGKKDKGKKAIERILARNDVPEWLRKSTQSNKSFYK